MIRRLIRRRSSNKNNIIRIFLYNMNRDIV